MVAIVMGSGLGLVGSSSSVLGAAGQLGAAGLGQGSEAITVNARTGNLIVQHQDELLIGRGPDISVIRTYNSNATFDFDNNDDWQLSLYKKLSNLTGTVNTAGSTLRLTGGDGAQLTYTYDATLGQYTNKDGGGAYDSLSYASASNTWTATDGDSRRSETFGASPTAGEWRITGQNDLDGNSLSYTYDANGLISQVSDANGETTKLTYDAATKRLSSIQVLTGAVTTTRVSYTYDASGRLSVVTTDLTPDDGSIADSKTYSTTYTYDGTSLRIASITNSDGTRVSFTYDPSFRVKTVVDGAGKITTFTYNTGNTTVTDPLGQSSTLTYDAAGNLTRQQGPTGSGQDVIYAYNSNGDLTQLTDSRGNAVTYAYDSNGNLLRQQDAAGNVVERAYNGANQLVKETAYAVADPDGAGSGQASTPQVTYYVRDAKQHVRFTVSPEGRVTEYRYNAQGQQINSLVYTATFNPATLAAWSQDFSVNTSGLTPATLPTAYVLTGGALQVTSTNQATTSYPNVYGAALPLGTRWRAEVITPATLAPSLISIGVDSGTWATANYRRLRASFGNGTVASEAYQGATYVGHSLGTIKPGTTYVVEVVTETDGGATLYVYEKGKALTSGYTDRCQFIVGQNASLAMQTYLGPTAASGVLGSTASILVDNLSSQLQPIEADLVTWIASQAKTGLQRLDTAYDARGLVSSVTRFTNTDATGAGLVDGSQSVTQYVYDSAGRLLQQIDPRGVATTGIANDYLTAYAYDGVGRTIRVTQYDAAGSAVGSGTTRQTLTTFTDASNRIEVSLANGLKRLSTFDQRGLLISQVEQDGATVLSTQSYQYDADGQLRALTDANGNKTYYLYDVGGRKVGEIDATGGLTEFVYDNAGLVTKSIRYANPVNANLATLFAPDGTGAIPNVAIASVRPPAASWADLVTRQIYDAAGRPRFHIDAIGYVTETRYDGTGRLLSTLAYANALNNVAGLDSLGREATPADIQLLGMAPTGVQIGLQLNATTDRVTRNLYDNDGLLRGTLDGEGYLTEYRYDAAGRLNQTIRYSTVTTAGDRAAGTLATLITSANATPATNIVSYAYYNGFGQQVGSLDGEGYYTAYQYDVAGNLTRSTRYANRLVGTALAGTAPQVVATVPGSVPAGGYVLSGTQDQASQGTWTAFGQIDTQTAVDGTLSKYTYDSIGNRLTTIIAQGAADSRNLQARYDKQGRLTQELSALGSIALAALGAAPTQVQIDTVWSTYGTTYTYDASGRRTKSTDANGNVTLFFYDKTNRLTFSVRRVRNPANAAEWQGEVSQRHYNALGQLTTEIRYANRILATPFGTLTGGSDSVLADASGSPVPGIIQADYAKDTLVQYAYNATGRLYYEGVELNDSGDMSDTYREFNAFGEENLRATILDNQNYYYRLEQLFYDRRGLLLSHERDVSDPNWSTLPSATGIQVTASYDAFGRVTSNTDSNGVVGTAVYDKLGRQIQSTAASGSLNLIRSSTYDAFGRVLTQTDALGKITTYGYAIDTATGKTTLTITTPEAIVTKVVSDRYGQTLTVVDGLGNETRNSYDANGRLTSSKRWDKAANVETTLETDSYDAVGNLLSTTDANGNSVAYSYDAANRTLTRRVDPTGLNLTTIYSYDAKGQQVSVTDPNGGVTQSTYDLAGRLTQVAIDPTGLNLRTQYAYDLAGNQITVVEGYGSTTARTTQHTYDSLGRRTQTAVDPAGLNLVTTYAYDKNDNLVTRVDAAGTTLARTTRYSYDQANRLVYVADALGGVVKNDYDKAGHLLQSTAYANAINLSGLATNPTVAAVAALITADTTRDRTTRHVYDNNGRERFTIDALGAVSENQYDANGNVVKRLQYANALQGTLNLGSAPPVVATVPGSGPYVLSGTADRITTYAYDAFNRLTSKTAASGTSIAQTESYAYDSVGNLVRHTDARGNLEWFAYDKANRQTRHIDQGGYVTNTAWNADGTRQSETRYVNAVALSTTDNLWAFAGHATNPAANTNAVSGDRTTSYTYDKAGRTATRSDAQGVVTRYAYDSLNNLLDTTEADGTALAATLHREYDTLGQVLAETRAYGTADASRTTYAYDAQGNQKTIVEAVGTTAARTTMQEFDVLGRKTAAVDGTGARTSTAYNRFGEIVKVTDALGNVGYFYNDALGRVTLQVDPEGVVTETRYDLLGNTTDSVKYANKLVGSASETTRPQILATAGTGVYVVKNDAADQHQQVIYDVLGRKSETRTWWGPNAADYYSETFTYDGNNNVLTAKARNGATTTYEYNKLDQKTREILPVTSKNAGNIDTAVENRFAYDALGNLSTRTEAYGLPEQRITSYTYDKLNRQVKEIGQAITTFDPVSQTDVVVTPTRQKIYNAVGNLVEEVDAKGARTLHYYDAQHRETGRVDAAGAFTQWTYDAAGNKTSQTAYANAVQVVGGGAIPNGTAPNIVTVAPTVAGTPYVLSDAANDRTVNMSYDAAGRLAGTRLDNMTLGAYNPNVGGGTYQVSTGSIATSTTYDALGNVVKTIDGNGNLTRRYYNKAGQQVGQLDAKGYLMLWVRDAYGNVAQETKYANAVSGTLTVTDTTPLATLVANVTASSDDRISVCTYDKLNRVKTETRKSVASGSVNATTGVLSEATADATTSYVYDGLNNVTRKTDAVSAVTDWTYDGLGRKTKEQKPGYADYLGSTVRPTTDTEYDGLNHVKREILRGTDNAVETDDRITTYTYGTGGFLSAQTDALGVVTQYRIDANGNVTKKTLVGRGNADGTTPVDDATLYQYDALNRQIKNTDNTTGTTQEMRYDAFGEVTGKRTNGGGTQASWQEFAQYDQAGRAWSSNSGDGVTKVYVFDANGNATLSIQSSGTDLTGQSLATVIARSDTLKTISVFDARNQLSDTFEPTMAAAHQIASVAASTAGQAVFISNGAAISIGAQSSVGAAPASTNPVTAGDVSVLGEAILGYVSGAVSGTTRTPIAKTAYYKYGQQVTATITLPTALPTFAGNIRAELSVTRPVYYNFGATLLGPYSYSPTQPILGKSGYVTGYKYGIPIYPSAYSSSPVVSATGNSSLTITAQSAIDAFIVGDQTYTIRLYQQTANGDVLLGIQTGTIGNGVAAPLSISTDSLLYLSGQPPAATQLLVAYRPAGSTGAYTLLNVPPMTNTAGATMAGGFALDWAAAGLSGGNYEFQYFALNSSGSVVNQQLGTLNLSNPAAPVVVQNNGALGAMGGAGCGLIDTAGSLNIFELGDAATSAVVKYRVKGSGSAWTSITPTKHSTAAGWFYLPYASYFAAGTTYELDITATNGSTVINKAAAEFSRDAGGNPSITAFTANNTQPAMVHLTERTDTQYLDINYRTNGSTGAYTTVRVNPTSAGVFDWDASALVAVATSNYDYDVVIKAYLTGGLLNNQTNTVLRLGANAAVLSATPQTTPLVLRLTPPQNDAASIKLGYRLQGSTGDYTTLATTLVSGEFRADLAGLSLPASGSLVYEYVYDVYNVGGALLGRDAGNFTLQSASASSSRLDWVIGSATTVSTRIHKSQLTNAFGEVVQETDGLGRVTNLSFNIQGQLIKKEDPETNVTLDNGFVQRARPTTRYVYDLAGRLVASIDPNGNTTTQAWLNGATGSQIALERHADGGLVSHGYDIFGDKRFDVDALGGRTDITYDKLSHVTQVAHQTRADSTRAIDNYTYDAAGHRITHTDALGDTEKTFYDSLGRVTQYRSYNGFNTTYSYVYSNAILGVAGLQVGGWKTTTTDAVGRTLIDEQDSFGHTTKHQDLGGHSFTYTYNAAGWLTNQTGTTGQNIATDHYANGNVKSIWDKATGAYTSYEYDAAGNRIQEGYIYLKNPADLSGGVRDYYQYANLEYDELNRLTRVLDPKAEIKYEYDAVGNRRHMVSTYHDGINGAMQTQDYWYKYDTMNRFTVTMGKLSNGTRGSSASDTSVSIVKGSTGVDVGYNLAGQRIAAANGSDGSLEQYSYSADGYLEDVKINSVLRSRRTNDLLGRVSGYTEWNAAAAQTYTRTTTYDKDSRTFNQTENNGGTITTTTNSYYTDATENAGTATNAGAGQLAKSVAVTGAQMVTSYTAYEYWDDAKEKAVTTQAWVPNLQGAVWRPGYASHSYDVNGHLKEAIDVTDGILGNGDDRKFSYVTDAQGLILVRDEIAGGSVNRVQRYYYANGVRVGDVGNDGPSRTDYAQAIAARGVDHKSYKNWKPVASADFDQNYEPVSPSYPGMTPGSYTVRTGDTLQGIARSIWGDAGLWYLIADSNGLTGSEVLKAGQVLTLPNKLTNIHNNAGTFRAYSAGEAMGDTSPTLPTPPPAPSSGGGGGCGIAQIIIAIIVVVVAYYTQQYYLAEYATAAEAGAAGSVTLASGTTVTTGSFVASAAVGGAVGSVVGQGLSMAAGLQDKFSWGAVAAGALGAAAGAGIGLAGFSTVVSAAAGNIASQGINILTGQQKSFSWSSLAASVIAAPIAESMSKSLLSSDGAFSSMASDKFGSALVRSTTTALVSATARLAIQGGKLQWESIAADALSSTIRGMYEPTPSQTGGTNEQPKDTLQREEAAAKLTSYDTEMVRINRELNGELSVMNGQPASSAPISYANAGSSTERGILPDVVKLGLNSNGGEKWGFNNENVTSQSYPVAENRIEERPLPDLAKPIQLGGPLNIESENLYRPFTSLFGGLYRSDARQALNPANSPLERVGYGARALITAIPGLVNDVGAGILNAPNDLYRGGQEMAIGFATKDVNRFSGGLMQSSVGILNGATFGAAAIEGVAANRAANAFAEYNQAARASYVDTVANEAASLTYKPTSGVLLQAQEGGTTTILGSYNNDMRSIVNELGNAKSTDFGPRAGGFNVLNVPDNLYITPKQFWTDYNKPWLSNSINRGDNFLMATRPAFEVADAKTGFSVLARPNPVTGKMELSGFGREYLDMKRAGYAYQNGAMVK